MKVSKKLFHNFYFFVLFLNFSETYRLLSYLIRKESSFISGITLALNLVYILINFSTFKKLLNNKIYVKWLLISPVLPVVYMVYFYLSNQIEFSDFQYIFLYEFLFGTLFIATSIFSYNVNFEFIKKIVWFSVISTIIGFILNFVYFDLFRDIGAFSGIDQSYVKFGTDQDRGISFFTMPNRAAFASICFFIIIFITEVFNYRSIRFYIFSFLILLCMVAVTGSRTSFLLLLLISVFFLFPAFIKMYRVKSETFVLILSFIFIVFSLILVFLPTFLSSLGYSSISDRIDIVSQLSKNSDEIQDKSLILRIEIISHYWAYIKDSFFFGRGAQFARKLLSDGTFSNISQNTFIDAFLSYGFFYLIVYISFLFSLYRFFNKSISNLFVFNPLKVFVFFFLLLGFSISNLSWQRPIVITMGILLGYFIRIRDNLKNNSSIQ